MKWFKWINGRNGSFNTPYNVMLLLPIWLCKYLNIDLVLIRMEKGSGIHKHMDNERYYNGWDCWRTNLVLKAAERGGNFKTYTETHSTFVKLGIFCGFIYYKFRPDLVPHTVSPVIIGTRWVLSFGKYTRSERLDLSKQPKLARGIIFIYWQMLHQCLEASPRNTVISVDPWSTSYTTAMLNKASCPTQMVAETIYSYNSSNMTMEECIYHVEECLE